MREQEKADWAAWCENNPVDKELGENYPKIRAEIENTFAYRCFVLNRRFNEFSRLFLRLLRG